jgi:hypothetical protein
MMAFDRFHSRALVVPVLALLMPVLTMLAIGLASAEGKSTYELIKDLFLPLVSPLVAILIPVVVLFVIPYNQNRQKVALELCTQYNTEEMRDARNVGWRCFVTEQQTLPPVRRAERLNQFLDYLSNPEFHRMVDPEQDKIFQKASRILDFFAIVNGCLARGVADPDIVRDFLLFYYLWWRDEIMDPLRRTRRVLGDGPKTVPTWWKPLQHLDALASRGVR